MSSERVTVIVPTYQHQDYLRCSLFSILNSTIPVEAIVVPVLSDAPTLEEIEHLNEVLSSLDRKVSVIPSNKPDVFTQIQLGLDNVHTEYFTVFGSDDFMLPNMVHKMLGLADESWASNPVVGLSFALTDEHLNITSIHTIKPFSKSHMMAGEGVIPDVALTKTEFARSVGGFTNGGIDFGYLNHFAMYHRLVRLKETEVILSPEIGFLYRQLPNSRHSLRYSTSEAIKLHRMKAKEVARFYSKGDGT